MLYAIGDMIEGGKFKQGKQVSRLCERRIVEAKQFDAFKTNRKSTATAVLPREGRRLKNNNNDSNCLVCH